MLPATMDYSAKQLDLIRKTVAADTNDDEFNLFIHTARHVRLDPLRRQIYCFVFNKNKPDKRQMTIVTSIGGYRTIAARTGNYRPDTRAPRFTYDDAARGDLNPTGLISAEVSVFLYMHGEWHEVAGQALWDEYVPIVENWGEDETGQRKPTGKRLDTKKQGWIKMPTIMLAKCAEAAALRKAWPDDFANVYTSDEMERQEAIELTATEIVEKEKAEGRLERVGGKNSILFDFSTPQLPKPLMPVPSGEVYDRVDEFLRQYTAEPAVVVAWREKNKEALKVYWAIDPNAALDIKSKLEIFEARNNEFLAKPQAARAALAAAE